MNHYHGGGVGHVSGKLRLSFFVAVGILAVEVAGGVLSNSLALLSDAAHVFTDIFALGFAWYAATLAERPPTHYRTFGFHRAGILAALANAVSLVVVAVVIIYEAYRRLVSPQAVDSGLMLGVAAVGLAANLGTAVYLYRANEENLNVRGAILHVLGDALASTVVVVGAIVIILTGVTIVDPILSIVVSLIIVGGGWTLVSESVNILMEGTPRGLDLAEIVGEIRAVPGVLDVHDVHAWSLAAGVNAMSFHAIVADQALSESNALLLDLNALLRERFAISHTTVQFEHQECGQVCTLFHEHLVPSDMSARVSPEVSREDK